VSKTKCSICGSVQNKAGFETPLGYFQWLGPLAFAVINTGNFLSNQSPAGVKLGNNESHLWSNAKNPFSKEKYRTTGFSSGG
jgi:hypothetical protein